MLEIRKFEDDDVRSAGMLAYDYWSGMVSGEGERFQRVIYEYMVRYYDRNRDFSFALTEDGKLVGFLLGCRRGDAPGGKDWLAGASEGFSPQDKRRMEQYKAYLNFNGARLEDNLGEDDVMLALFISRRKGGGGMLADAFGEKCRREGVARIFLWTDTTSNYQYYPRHGFEEIARFKPPVAPDDMELWSILYKKPVE